MIHAEENKAVIQWKRCSNFNRILNTMAYVQQTLNRYKRAIFVVRIEDKSKAKAITFGLPQ